MALFESYERRIAQIEAVLKSYGISSIEEAEKITKDAGLDVYNQIKAIQPICFENACWAYIVGAAIAIKKDCRKAADAAGRQDRHPRPLRSGRGDGGRQARLVRCAERSARSVGFLRGGNAGAVPCAGGYLRPGSQIPPQREPDG